MVEIIVLGDDDEKEDDDLGPLIIADLNIQEIQTRGTLVQHYLWIVV